MSKKKEEQTKPEGIMTMELLESAPFDPENDQEKAQSYILSVEGAEDEMIPRNVTLLMDRLAKLPNDKEVEIFLYRLTAQASDETNEDGTPKAPEIEISKYRLMKTTAGKAFDDLFGTVIPGDVIIKRVCDELNKYIEFSDVNTVMITAVFNKQGVGGNTWTNPVFEPTQENSNKVYESAVAHADRYKDHVKKTLKFVFASDNAIKPSTMADMKRITGKR